MAKPERPLTVDIPRPGTDQPVWSRVGIIGIAGFLLGILWPRVAGVRLGPSVPADLAAKVEAASPSGAPRALPSGVSSAAPAGAPSASASPAAEAPSGKHQELVMVGPGKITKCWDKKDKKIDDCEKLLFDPIAVKRLRELARCPSALGLSGKMSIGFEVNFDKKDVQIKNRKGSTLPASTIGGIIACAAREFATVPLDEVPHKHRRYNLVYGLTFYPPGKHPEGAAPAEPGDDSPAAGSTTSESEATGSATIAWDTALLRKDPKDGEVVARIVRGTRVKIIGKQNDWYKIESGTKAGWVYRGAIGL
jgi:hypothetical protein